MELVQADAILHYTAMLTQASQMLEDCQYRLSEMTALVSDGWKGGSADVLLEKLQWSAGQLRQSGDALEQAHQLLRLAAAAAI